jgi:hypothetical protein
MVKSDGLSQARLGRIAPALRRPIDNGELAGLVALIARGEAVYVEVLGMQDLESRTPMRRDERHPDAAAADDRPG